MDYKEKPPILVTGSHRSGTTWVGRIIAKSKDIGYINEPLSLWQKPGILYPRPNVWYKYISEYNSYEYLNSFNRMLDFRYNLNKDIKSIISFKDILRLIKNQLYFYYNHLLNKRPLIKEPHAIFASEWMYKKFNTNVVVMIRHPAAFAGSLKRVNWKHPFDHFLRQKELIQDHLPKFEKEIERYVKEKKNIIEQAILLWNIIYSTVYKYTMKNYDWMFIRHEDISREPEKYFKKIFNYIDVRYTNKIDKQIKKYSGLICTNRYETLNINDIKINSKSNIYNWKDRLTEEEIKQVKYGTFDTWKYFYKNEEW